MSEEEKKILRNRVAAAGQDWLHQDSPPGAAGATLLDMLEAVGLRVELAEAPPKRRKLSSRRQGLKERIDWIDPHSGAVMGIYVGAGIDRVDGTIREIFMRPAGKLGKNSLLERILDACAVSLSFNLQYGMTVYELAGALGAANSTTQLGNASPVEEALIAAARFQAAINGWPPGAATLQPPASVPKKGETT